MSYQQPTEIDNKKNISAVKIKYINRNKESVKYLILIIGFMFIFLSVYLGSSILANLSIGVIFIGIFFIFIQTEQYFNLNILISSLTPYYKNISSLIDAKLYNGSPIYYSSGNLETMKDPLLLIPKNNEIEMPLQISIKEIKNVLDSNYLIFNPPGLDLMHLIENEMKASIPIWDLLTIGDSISAILVDNFQLLKSIIINIESNNVRVIMNGNTIYYELVEKVSKELIHNVGDIITSAIACIITKNTLSPVRINSIKNISNNSISVEYEIIKNN